MQKNIFTIDLEDWLQSSLELFQNHERFKNRSQPSEKVVINANKVMEILDRFNVKATWFVLSSVAEKFPDIIRTIRENGHEIASHGSGHELVYNISPQEFYEDVKRSKELLEDIIGEKIRGYRAPYFSITKESEWALDVLKELDFDYDSSIFPINRQLYGFPGAERFPFKHDNGVYEFPISTIKLVGKVFPVGGGGYFRILPKFVNVSAYDNISKSGLPIVFYMHPYEVDDMELKTPLPLEKFRDSMIRFQQDFGRSSVERKLDALLKRFPFGSISEWLESNEKDLN